MLAGPVNPTRTYPLTGPGGLAFSGCIRALGRILGTGMHTKLPRAQILPTSRTTKRSCLTAHTGIALPANRTATFALSFMGTLRVEGEVDGGAVVGGPASDAPPATSTRDGELVTESPGAYPNADDLRAHDYSPSVAHKLPMFWPAQRPDAKAILRAS